MISPLMEWFGYKTFTMSQKKIHIFQFVSPNVNRCVNDAVKCCCTLLTLTTRKLHPCNWQLWTIYNVESFHSEPLVLHVGNICAPPPGKTRRCQQCAKAPAEIAPSPSNTIGTLEKPKSFSLNLVLGELPTLHQIKTVQYWFRSGNGLNHDADSAKKSQAAVKLAMSNNNCLPKHTGTWVNQANAMLQKLSSVLVWLIWVIEGYLRRKPTTSSHDWSAVVQCLMHYDENSVDSKPQSAAQAPDHFKDTVWEVQDNACNSPCLAPRQWLSSQRLGQYNKNICIYIY